MLPVTAQTESPMTDSNPLSRPENRQIGQLPSKMQG